MYDELVNRLRAVVNAGMMEEKCDGCPYEEDYPCCVDCLDKLHKQAADAIEELSMKLHGDEAAIAGMKREIERMVVNGKPGWIKFTLRPLTEEEQREHPDWCDMLDCPTPDDGQEIHVSNGRYVWTDTFYNDEDGCYLDGGSDLEGCWWQPMPEPPKEE